MLHGPCGGNILDAPCIIDKKCSKHFPKPYNAKTTIDEDGYAHYRRRNTGIKVSKGKGTLDNSFVVPYNRYLLLKYSSHINVEWCNRSRAIKYLFKYLNKGPDRATIVIQENLGSVNGSTTELASEVDEIKNYLDCRYLSPCEAVWRMFSFDIHFSKPSELNWETLAEDILYKKTQTLQFSDLILSESQLRNYCLLEIQGILKKNGKSLSDFPDLPQPDPGLLTQLENHLIREELNYNLAELRNEHQNLYVSLNPEQLKIYNQVISAVTQQAGGLFFLYGPGGSGKAFVYKTILTKLRSEKLIALSVASSGITSLLLLGGRTAHSRFVIPLELMENSTCRIKQKTHLAELMQQVRLIIWDEAPMTQRFAFEALDKTLKDILGAKNEANRSKLFGGIPILLGGDFRQILPIIPTGKRQEIVQACINRSDLWQSCQLHTLSRIMRVNEFIADGQVDPRKQQFNKWVLDIGDSKVSAVCKDGKEEPTGIEIPNEFIVKSDKPPIDAIVDTIFPDFLQRHKNEDYLSERAILTPRNDDADQINKHMFKKLQGQTMIYKSSDEICKGSTDAIDQHQSYPVEYLNKLNFPGVPPHKLKLKIGQPIMLLRNLYPSAGMCNGTCLIITDFQKFVIQARIITGSHVGNMVIIHRIVLTSAQTKWPFVMQRIQFLVRPCYAMTINKSQGQSLDYVGLYLPKPVFIHGQLYVALSRVTNPNGLKIVMVGDTQGRLHNHTRDVVYKETFHKLNQNI
ncbi:uncharacterized protein [Rutidosis leptorrhynchoides]|uniref:uncharacterized protein n=1 Tax=Rutidosis leptorrhynchoides TaxID=125765 RepID=UPI003A9A027F